ncbi:MAG: dihydrofolate reductase family protein [Gammaproteobacteria bacterium]|jgi:riboflavin biosynthesis pyrimidine reductase
MQQDVIELFPQPGARRALQGLYLKQLLETPGPRDGPFIFSNFISSLDGRIAIPGPGRSSHQVPPAIANARDWRLFQELAAQADLLITSARYFRQVAGKEEQAELPLGSSAEFEDLRRWRNSRGMSPQPDIAVLSASLDIPLASLRFYEDRKLYLITGAAADDDKLQRLLDASHAEAITCGHQGHVDARILRAKLAALGYRRVYAIAGPAVLHTLVQGDALDRLYQTTAHCLLGGTRFDTFVRGPLLEPAFCMALHAMYYDPLAPEDAGQTLAIYDRQAPEAEP